MYGYWFNFNRGFIQPSTTIKLNKRYIGMPTIPEEIVDYYIFGYGYLFGDKTPKDFAIFGDGYTPYNPALFDLYIIGDGVTIWDETRSGTLYSCGEQYSAFDESKSGIGFTIADGYVTDWRGDE